MKRQKKYFIFTIIMILSVITTIIVIQNRYIPESKAETSSSKTLKVRYKSGIGEGEDVVVTQNLCDSQSKGSNDYTDGKVVLYRNGENGENGVNFTASKIEYNGVKYDRILTGWKLTSVIKNGKEITEFIEPENQNYADKTNANKDIGTVYAQEGWYIVPDGVTEITVEAVYARAIYVRSPYDKMYYDEFHIFYYGENSDGTTTLEGTAVAKSSDDNDGSTEEKAVSTLKRAYALITASSELTAYDTAFVLCGDMYEINYNSAGSKYATETAGTYKNYSSGNFGYNSSATKPVTIANKNGKNYKIYTCTQSYDFNVYSSLRLDNIYIGSLLKENIKKVHSESTATINTYSISRQFRFQSNNMIFETTETVTSSLVAMWYRNIKVMKINGGNWRPTFEYSITNVVSNKFNYIVIGGMAAIDFISTSSRYNSNNSEACITNPTRLIVTGGRITTGIYGTGYVHGGSVKGDVNIFISGGNIANVYGGGNGSVYANGEEKGNVNIVITGGTFGNIYGGGQYYTSKIYGDVNIKIDNAKVTGNIYGGGKGGQVEGNINIDIKNSKIRGNTFGGGLGLTDGINYIIAEVGVSTSLSYEEQKNTYNKKAEKSNFSKWEEAPSGFPIYSENTSEVIARRYHNIYLNTNNQTLFREYGNKYFLSLSTIGKDITMNIENSTIGKSVYGGGSIGLVEGNINVTMKNTNVEGTVYGGGDGKTTPSTVAIYSPIQDYKELTVAGADNNTKIGNFTWINDKDILTYFKGIYDGKNKVIYNADNTTTAFSELSSEAQKVITKYGTKQLVYSSDVDKLGYVEGNITLKIEGGSYKSAIYGGGNNGQVKGKVTLEVGNILSGQEVYTGGNTGNVEKDTKLTINSGTYGTVFGGGYSGKVLGNSTVEIIKGTYANIFGGGDQSYIQGSTNVTVGQENSNESLIVTGLVYGGGRGYDANGDGDASDFTTVYGSSKVLIQGINTKVENYGSIKLGAVAGNVDVNFKNYWSGNSTAKYKTMNGIDRATTVSFDNSYVLLENRDSSRNLVGIQAIENLVIPNGSGLKISANGEITGNFEGGGELYLDSLVCLTVKGNITGQTTLVLNPKLIESGAQAIRGGIKLPYLKVGGTAPEEIALVSGESNKYLIIQADKKKVQEEVGENYIYYYIAEDVIIENDIVVQTNSEEGRKYREDISNKEDVKILNKGIYTTEMKNTYYLTSGVYNPKDYTNITRRLKLISNTEEDKEVIIPKGTEISMIVDGEYYYYIVKSENITEISLSEFQKSSDSTIKYTELKDITKSDLVEKTTNEVNGTTSYSFKENYRLIFNFENTKGIEVDRYYPSLEVYYGETTFGNEKKDVANNIVDIQKREYTINLTKDRDYYENNSLIKLEGNLEIGSLKENTYLKSQNLYLKLELKDADNNVVKIPEGTKVTINNSNYEVKKGNVIVNILNNLGTVSVNKKLDIGIDMTGVLKQDRIPKGEYKISVEYLNEREYEEIVEQEITVIEKQEGSYGIKAVVNAQDGVSDEELQIIKNEEETTRNIKIEYENASELKNMKIKIKAIERTGEFEYQETTNSKNKITLEKTEININETNEGEQDIKVTFQKGISKGTYRIQVELSDEYDNIKTSDYVNFIVD